MAAVVGATIWQGTTIWTGRREAWYASEYWTIAYPTGLVLAAVIGYLVPAHSAWGVGLSLMLAQAVTLAFASQSFGLLPIGTVLFGFLALPVVATAAFGARLGRLR
jgi:hypothetical protein